MTITDFDGEPAEGKHYHVDWDAAAAEKGGYPSFMAKEINEQPHAVADTLLGRSDSDGRLVLDEMRIDEDVLRTVDKIIVIACGTAAYAGQVAKYAIEHWSRIPVEVELAHEFRYRDPVVDREHPGRGDLPVRRDHGHAHGGPARPRAGRPTVLAICNTNGSTIPRESDAVLYTHAGPEIAVASTKAFLAQITACYLLGLYLAQLRGDEVRRRGRRDPAPSSHAMPAKIQQVLDGLDQVRATRPATWRTPGRCCSSAATSATRWRWRARSSSRSSPTSTPRASRPASSSTARSR